MANSIDPPATPAQSGGRVLFVDDDAFTRRIINAALINRGFSMRLADSAVAALAILRTEPIDIVLTDVQMPGLSGLDLMKRMRDEGFNTPVILLTRVGSVEMAVSAVRSGAVHYLTKPVDPHVLEQLITDILFSPQEPRAGTAGEPPRP
jgi:DNA-binding NtrC family response regulator